MIFPTGPQIIQVPIVTSPVPPQPASVIILQPQFPIAPAMQQPPTLATNAMYLPAANGMMHLNYASQLPTTLHTAQFPTILPNTFICTQNTIPAAPAPTTQVFSVNFS